MSPRKTRWGYFWDRSRPVVPLNRPRSWEVFLTHTVRVDFKNKRKTRYRDGIHEAWFTNRWAGCLIPHLGNNIHTVGTYVLNLLFSCSVCKRLGGTAVLVDTCWDLIQSPLPLSHKIIKPTQILVYRLKLSVPFSRISAIIPHKYNHQSCWLTFSRHSRFTAAR